MKQWYLRNQQWLHRVGNLFCVLILAVTFGILFMRWGQLPDTIPTHYNLAGEADSWGGKASIWFCPILNLFLFGLMTAVEQFPQTWNTGVKITPANREMVYALLHSMLVVLKLGCLASLGWLTVCEAYSRSPGVWFLPVFMAVIFVPIVGFLVLLGRQGR